MKKRNFSLFLLATSMILLFSQCEKSNCDSYPFKFQFITENYKPLNYQENSVIKGLAPDLLKEICDHMNIPFKVTLLPWEEGYSLLQSKDNAVLFSTVMNSVRKDMFKWAGPIASLDWFFYSASQSQIALTSLDDAKKIAKIGALKDYSIEQYLVGQGFTNLVYCKDNIEAFDKLLKGEIDLFPSDKITAEAALKTLNKSVYNVTSQLTIRTEMVYFAFNKNIPDNVVADFQMEIDRLKANGTLRNLSQQYLNTSDVLGTLQIYTEQYPPLTFRNSFGEITGFGSDIVCEILKRNHLFIDIKLSSWSNGYELALYNPNVCLFTMDKTDLRKNLFQWVGPIGTNTTYFYTKAGSGITISSIAQAKSLAKVGTVSSWFSDQYLRTQGFTNLVSDNDPAVMVKKLMQGEINAFVCSSVTFPDILKSQGYQYTQTVAAFSLMSSDYFIAFSNNTPASVVSQWQTTLAAMKLDGTYDAISKKWFP